MGSASLSQAKKVMVFGTFDGLHQGHLNFFKQARKYGNKLIVVVARDENVRKIKGRLPKLGERARVRGVKQGIKGSRDQVISGSLKDPYQVIRKYKPNVICLGYDQYSFTKGLNKKFPKIKIVRLKPYKAKIYKSSKMNYEF
jgi:FAD synthetase